MKSLDSETFFPVFPIGRSAGDLMLPATQARQGFAQTDMSFFIRAPITTASRVTSGDNEESLRPAFFYWLGDKDRIEILRE